MRQCRSQILAPAILFVTGAFVAASYCRADDKDKPVVEGDASKQPAESPKEQLIKLSKDHDIWVDPQRKLVVVDGTVAIRDAGLEMFACPKGSKEHESVVAVNSTAQLVHAGLLAIGAIAGHPVQFNPKYVPATGTTVDVWVLWQDELGKHKVRAQEWVKDTKTGEEMKQDWVFGGSSFWTDDTTGEKYYQADGGDLICLSNFSTATLDLPIESSQANDALLFNAFTERIPPRGTKVRLVLIPRLEKKSPVARSSDEAPKPASGVKLREEQETEVEE